MEKFARTRIEIVAAKGIDGTGVRGRKEDGRGREDNEQAEGDFG